MGVVGVLKSMWGWISKNRTMLLQLGAAVMVAVVAWRAFMIINAVLKAVRIGLILFKAWRMGTLAMTAAQLGLNAAILANPIGIALIALTALVAGIIIAYNKVSWFRSGINWLWGAVKTVFNWIKTNWPLLAGILGGPIGLGVAMIIKHWGGVKSAVVGGVNWIIDKINGIIGAMNTAIGAFNKLPGPDIGKISTIGAIGGSDVIAANTKAAKSGGGNLGTTGHMARGGVVRQPGVYEVGERGRERVHLPAGAAVEPNGGFGGDLTIPVTLMMPNGDVLARHVAKASTRRKAAR